MQTYIEIFDDEVNEASEQDFLAYLEVVEAVNMSLIQIFPVTSCRILDNDGKCVRATRFNKNRSLRVHALQGCKVCI